MFLFIRIPRNNLAALMIAGSLLLLSWVPLFLAQAWMVPPRILLRRPTSANPPILKLAKSNNNNNNNHNPQEPNDWREFRAKLVLQQQGEKRDAASSASTASSSWAYEAGTVIEKGSIVLSRVESSLGCHDLRQPYFHKCAILVLEHDECSTKGIILNRPSNLICSDADILLLEEEQADDDDDDEEEEEEDDDKVLLEKDEKYLGDDPNPNPNNAWPMNFGGDIGGLFSEEPRVVVLHSHLHNNDDNDTMSGTREVTKIMQDCSEEILPNLFVTSHLGARSLMAANHQATCQDFFTFYGYCLWEPEQLQREIHRGSWYSVSMDSQSVLESLQQLRDDATPQGAGLACWEDWTRRIHKEKQERVEESRNFFSDLMLKEWCQEMLCTDGDGDDDDNFNLLEAMNSDEDDNNDDDALVRLGSLVQASGDDPTTYLLFDQLFHKSTILLLRDEADYSLGLILNLPTMDAYVHTLPNGTDVRIPIRYGGPLGHDDDDDYNDDVLCLEDGASRILWLHHHPQLRALKVGQPIRSTSDNKSEKSPSTIWTCSQIQALNAMDMGLVQASDFFAVQGYVLWEKEYGAGGIEGQIVSGALRPVDDGITTEEMWSLLSSQSTVETLEDINSIFASTHQAWEWGRPKLKMDTATNNDNDDKKIQPRCVYGSNVTLPDLADEALRKWMEIFILD